MKKIILLGATGSIGDSTLKVLRKHRNNYDLIGVSIYNNVTKLEALLKEFDVKHIAIRDENVSHNLKTKAKILYGKDGLLELSSMKCDILVSGISGVVGLLPAITTLRSGNNLAIANKEPLVVAGSFFMEEAKKNNSIILPVDSEHNSIFQCFNETQKKHISHITLTASGGPFLKLDEKEFNKIKVKEAIQHPIWKMGKKISIDSATLINKALEIIEAGILFNLTKDKIQILIHPQSIIHGMVHYKDGSVLANLSYPDMVSPLSVALSFPDRLDMGMKELDLSQISKLTFERPNLKKFPGLKLGWDILEKGSFYPIIFNAANEVAVEKFLKGIINFNQILDVINYSLDKFTYPDPKKLDDILSIDQDIRLKLKSFKV